MQSIEAWEKRLEERLARMDEARLEHYAVINDSVEKIARLERMVFLMLSIMNGTIFAGGPGVGNCDTFGDQLEELWRLQREAEEPDWMSVAAIRGMG